MLGLMIKYEYVPVRVVRAGVGEGGEQGVDPTVQLGGERGGVPPLEEGVGPPLDEGAAPLETSDALEGGRSPLEDGPREVGGGEAGRGSEAGRGGGDTRGGCGRGGVDGGGGDTTAVKQG